jgi:SSS family solute:Na+ symporter
MANESKSGFKQEGLDLHQKTGDDEITQGRESRPIDILLLSIAGIFLLLGVTNIVITASGESTVAVRQGSGLAVIDWIIIVIYALLTIGLGWYVSRRQKTKEEYFIGSGKMNPILVGVSLFATLLSTISYLSMPGEILGKGPAALVTLPGMLLIYFIVAYLILPLYMRQRVTSAYELLEAKLGIGIRLLGACMFILLRLVWMSLLIYLASMAMTVMMGVDEKWIPLIVLITGSVAVIYTSLGGLKAVVITDLVQTILLFGGALTVIAIVTIDFGGFSWFPREWNKNWDVQPLFSWDLSTRVTVFAAFLNMMTWYICTAAGDQTCIQRFMSTGSAAAARKAFKVQLIVSVVVSLTLAAVGVALLEYFQKHSLPADISIKTNADQVFPYFIGNILPPGVSGLVVAAMFAAAMSSIDSGVNSITAVVSSDFLDRFGKTTSRRTSMWLALAIGAIVVVSSSAMGLVPGNITSVTQKTTNLLVTPIFALFFFAIFVPFARPLGVIAGCVTGTVTALLVAFSGGLFGFVTETPFAIQLEGMTAATAFEHSRPTRISLPENAGKLLQEGDTLVLKRPDQHVVLEFDNPSLAGRYWAHRHGPWLAEKSFYFTADYRGPEPGVIPGHLVVKFHREMSAEDIGTTIIKQLDSIEPPFHATTKSDNSLALDLELDPISFYYIGIFALLANLSVGTLVSYLLSRRKPGPHQAKTGRGTAKHGLRDEDAGEDV